MSPLKNILTFAGLSALYFCLLTIPWPGPWGGPAPHLMDAYRWVFRGVGNAVFVRLGDGGSVKFSPYSRSIHEFDTTIRVTNRKTGGGGSGEIKSIYIGYRPVAFLTALIFATPIPWRRRGFALCWGLLLVGLFTILRVWLRLALMMSGNDPVRAYELTGWVKDLLMGLNGVLVRSPAVGYIVPALVWILVTLRRDDWARFGIKMGPDNAPEKP